MKQVLVIVSLLMAATSAVADLANYSEDQVKRHYLNCDYVSSQRTLDSNESAHCAAVANRLLKHHFRGDLEGLLSWWRAEREGYRASVSAGRGN